MTTRRARFACGWIAALVSLCVAACSHALAVGTLPATAGLALYLAFSAVVCVLLAGRTLSLTRLSIGVTPTQLMFHELFSLHADAPLGTRSSAGVGMHHGIDGMVLQFGAATSNAASMTGSMPGSMSADADLRMWAGHAIGAPGTIAALGYGERVFWGLLRLAGPDISRGFDAVQPVETAVSASLSDPPAVIDCSTTIFDSRSRNFSKRYSGVCGYHNPRNSMKKKILVTTRFAIAAPLAAGSHVEVTPNTAAAGSYADISLRVPTESTTATITKLEVDMPAATPFPSESDPAVPGWDTELPTETPPTPVTVDKTQITEGVTGVIWSALPGSEIKVNEIRQFTLSVGAVSDTGKSVRNAPQTCGDGSVVAWTGSGDNADHQSPVLCVNDTLARVLGSGGLVVGAVGVVLSVVALRRGVTG